jgi:hypothetical protein
LNSMPAKAVSGLSSSSGSQNTSYFLVPGFGSGAYSAKLLNGTRQRFSGFSHARQWGDDEFWMLVTGGPPNFDGGGMPQRIMISSRSLAASRITGGLLALTAQYFAGLPVDKVQLGASEAGDHLIFVVGHVLVVVQPMLDFHRCRRAGENGRGHHQNMTAMPR